MQQNHAALTHMSKCWFYSLFTVRPSLQKLLHQSQCKTAVTWYLSSQRRSVLLAYILWNITFYSFSRHNMCWAPRYKIKLHNLRLEKKKCYIYNS